MCVPENSHNSIKPRQSMLCRGESLEGICEKKDDYYQSVYQQSEQDITKVILEGILSVSVGEDGREYADNVYAIKKHYLYIQYEEYI